MEEILKYCNVCEKYKSESEFYSGEKLNNNKKEMYEYCCLACENELKEQAKRQKKYKKGTTKNLKKKTYEVNVSEKECSDCHEIKLANKFSKNCRHTDGLASKCKDCSKKYNTKYRIANHEKIVEQKRTAYLENPNRLEDGAKWREENRDIIRKWDRDYNKKNRKQKTARDRIYRANRRQNDHVFRAYQSCKKILTNYIKKFSKFGKVNKSREFIDSDIFNVLGKRPYDNFHLDHIIPLRAFDPNSLEQLKLAHIVNNLRWLAASENDSKSDYIFWELIEADEKLLEIANVLKLTKEDNGKRASVLFPIIDSNFVGRV